MEYDEYDRLVYQRTPKQLNDAKYPPLERIAYLENRLKELDETPMPIFAANKGRTVRQQESDWQLAQDDRRKKLSKRIFVIKTSKPYYEAKGLLGRPKSADPPITGTEQRALPPPRVRQDSAVSEPPSPVRHRPPQQFHAVSRQHSPIPRTPSPLSNVMYAAHDPVVSPQVLRKSEEAQSLTVPTSTVAARVRSLSDGARNTFRGMVSRRR